MRLSVSRYDQWALLAAALVGGLGQFVALAVTRASFSTVQFAYYATWSSAFGYLAVMLGSPIATAQIIGQNQESRELASTISFAMKAALPLGFIASVSWLITLRQTLTGAHLVPATLLLTSGLVHSFSGWQRGHLGFRKQWRLVASQVALEGLIRGAVTAFFIAVDSSLEVATAVSFAASLIAPLVIHANFKVRLPEVEPVKLRGVKILLPFWLLAIAQHLVITASPMVVSMTGNTPEVVSNVAFGMFVVRIPITLLSSILGPYIREASAHIGHNDYGQWRNTLFTLSRLVVSVSSLVIVLLLVLRMVFHSFWETVLTTFLGGQSVPTLCLVALLLAFLTVMQVGAQSFGRTWVVAGVWFLVFICSLLILGFKSPVSESEFWLGIVTSLIVANTVFAILLMKIVRNRLTLGA